MTFESADVAVTRLINGLSGHNPALDAAMLAVAIWGVPLLVLAVALQWWSGTDRAAHRHVLVAAGLSVLLGEGLNQIVLLLVDRTRPYVAGVTHLLTTPSADPSFPSDHTTAAAAIAVAFALHRQPRQAALFGLAATLVAVSRVWIGIHYAGDVLGGAVTGTLAALLVRALYLRGTRVDRIVTGLL